jgi:hypothetical protein
MAMFEKIVVQEESDQRQASEGISMMTRTIKKEYLSEWLSINNDMLLRGDLGIPMIGEPTPQFCGGVFFSMSYSNEVVPYLQNVFQAAAAHMNFSKYTLFSCYVPLLMQTHLLLLLPFYLTTRTKLAGKPFLSLQKNSIPALITPTKLSSLIRQRDWWTLSKRYFLEQAISTAHTIGERTLRSTVREARRLILVHGCMVSSSVQGLKSRLNRSR